MFVQIGNYRINLDQVAYIRKSTFGAAYYFHFISSEGTHELDFNETDLHPAIIRYINGKMTRDSLIFTLTTEG